MKTILIICIAFLAFSFKQDAKTQLVTIKTSAECGECKDRIESKLNYTKGIVFSELDYKTQVLTVKFKPTKITLQQIKQIVSDLGYDADEVKANVDAQKALPSCCQPHGMGK
jgi:periplasmic mercuric ion binding protein